MNNSPGLLSWEFSACSVLGFFGVEIRILRDQLFKTIGLDQCDTEKWRREKVKGEKWKGEKVKGERWKVKGEVKGERWKVKGKRWKTCAVLN